MITVPGLHCGERTERDGIHQEVYPEAEEVLILHQRRQADPRHHTGHFIPRCQIPEHYYQGTYFSYADLSDPLCYVLW